MHHGFLKKPNMHIKMIFEGSCDTEDWQVSIAITGKGNILKYIKIENNSSKL